MQLYSRSVGRLAQLEASQTIAHRGFLPQFPLGPSRVVKRPHSQLEPIDPKGDTVPNSKNMPSIENEVPPALLQEMLAKMGRNLLRFQQIESGLKLFLPMTHPDGSACGDDAYEALKKEVKLKTLGGLRTRLIEAITTADPESFSSYLSSVVDGRNNFIHHFLQQPGISLSSQDGVRAAVSYLDAQYEFTEGLFALTTHIVVQFATVLNERDNLGEF